MHDSVVDQPNSLAEKDLTKCLVELTAIDMQGSEIDVVWRLSQPLARDILLLRPVSEFQNNMVLKGCDALLQQKLHWQAEPFQQIRRRPVQRLADRVGIDGIRLDTDDLQACIGEMNRGCHPREAATNDCYIDLICLALHRRFGVRCLPLL